MVVIRWSLPRCSPASSCDKAHHRQLTCWIIQIQSGWLIAYEAFANFFLARKPLKRPITYAVTLAEDKFDFSNIDRWYERDGGERVGAYVLYRLKLRN